MGGISHGRGGAGNIYSREHQPTSARNFVTPTIKQDVYTTGRGGSGNMVHNDPQHPELARESQDVDTPPLRVEEAPHHTGRGGAANAYFPSSDEEKKVREEEEQLRRVYTASRHHMQDMIEQQEERQEERQEEKPEEKQESTSK